MQRILKESVVVAPPEEGRTAVIGDDDGEGGAAVAAAAAERRRGDEPGPPRRRPQPQSGAEARPEKDHGGEGEEEGREIKKGNFKKGEEELRHAMQTFQTCPDP